MERANEVRIETIVPHAIRNKVIQAMLKAHPYEEVAYDLYAMDLKGDPWSWPGRQGLKEPMTLAELVDVVKEAGGPSCSCRGRARPHHPQGGRHRGSEDAT